VLLDYATIIGRAAWVRSKAGLKGTAPPYSTRAVLETCFPHIAVTGASLPPHVTEMAMWQKGKRALFYNRAVQHPQQRVGLAHGLYHHLEDMKTDEGLRECNLVARRFAATAGTSDPLELACDLFAAELLIPLDVLDTLAPRPLWGAGGLARGALEDEYDHLASRFNVPKGFIKWRLYDLHVLRGSHFDDEG
jgi:Zn-dependent peptidase ImmA (M78 family)